MEIVFDNKIIEAMPRRQLREKGGKPSHVAADFDNRVDARGEIAHMPEVVEIIKNRTLFLVVRLQLRRAAHHRVEGGVLPQQRPGVGMMEITQAPSVGRRTQRREEGTRGAGFAGGLAARARIPGPDGQLVFGQQVFAGAAGEERQKTTHVGQAL
ncbi:MAG: hypothetical protein BWZ10_01675 [candidate division BRC1 bacterium ADurb.BinA364]|nr:MAG: hypothetical protein BWZ10_01675 [candidate division BRC1 bacterium ADurb.BinA364]